MNPLSKLLPIHALIISLIFSFFPIHSTRININLTEDRLSTEWNVQQNKSFVPGHHMNTKSPYWTTFANEQEHISSRTLPIDQSQCIPLHFNYVARHGSREPTANDVNKFFQLQAKLNKYKDAITNPDFVWMKDWQSPYRVATAGDLDVFGEQDHYNISKRWLNSDLKDLLSQTYRYDLYPIQTTQIPRTARSGNAFGFGLLEGRDGHLGPSKFEPFFTYSESTNQDYTLRFFDNCPLYEESVVKNATVSYHSDKYKSTHIGKVIEKVTAILGLNPAIWNLTASDVSILYKACAFDISVTNDTSRFCKLFDQEDILMFEYADDLDDYYMKGYGTPLAYQISCPLLVDFINRTEAVLAGKTEELAKLRFAHAETILPFAALLGLFRDEQPLMWNSSDDVIANRKWKTSHISPFAANIAWILYNCSGTIQLQLLHNEEIHSFPACRNNNNNNNTNGTMCEYSRVKSWYSDIVNNCNLASLCDEHHNTEPSTSTTSQEAPTEFTCPVCPTGPSCDDVSSPTIIDTDGGLITRLGIAIGVLASLLVLAILGIVGRYIFLRRRNNVAYRRIDPLIY